MAKSLLMYGTGSYVVMGPSADPVHGLIQSQHQDFSVIGDKVGKPFCLKQQPKPFDGVDVRRIRRATRIFQKICLWRAHRRRRGCHGHRCGQWDQVTDAETVFRLPPSAHTNLYINKLDRPVQEAFRLRAPAGFLPRPCVFY